MATEGGSTVFYRRALTALVSFLGLALGCANAPLASAGDYAVHGCRFPDGASIGGADGWSWKTNGTQYEPHLAGADCGKGIGVFAPAGRTYRNGTFGTVQFTAPPDTGVVGAEIWPVARTSSSLTAKMADPQDGTDWHINQANSKWFGGEAGPPLWSYDERVAFRSLVGPPRTHFGMWLECIERAVSDCRDDTASADGYQGYIAMTRSRLVLRDDYRPTVSPIAGSLVSPGSKEGGVNWRYDAADRGSGVFRELMFVDGVEKTAVILNDNSGRCRSVAWQHSMGLRDFVHARPCVTNVVREGRIDFKDIGVPNGEHEVALIVEDASGERTSVWSGKVLVGPSAPPGTNPSAANSSNTPDAAGAVPGAPQLLGLPAGQANGSGASRRARLVVGFARRGEDRLRASVTSAVSIKGRLLDEAGRGIGGARLEVEQLVRGSIDREEVVATKPDGSFELKLPARRSSRRIVVGYRAFGGDDALTTSKELSLTVVGSTTIKADKRKLRNRQRVRISGKLVGTPVPEDGVVVAVQGRAAGGRWTTFATARAGSSGRWARTYTFRSTYRTTRYQFRARVQRDSGYAYEPSTSKAVNVLVRP